MSDTVTQANTPSRNTRARAWCLTINNYSSEDLLFMESLKALDTVTHLVYGLEEGESGTPHIQAVIRYKNPVFFDAMKKKFPTAHIEVCKNLAASINYCKKEGEHSEKVPDLGPQAKDPLDGKELLPWQNEVMQICASEPDDRSIYWYWEETGCVGKTTLAKHLCLTTDTIVLSGKASDCKYTVCSWIESNKRFPKIILFHYTRSVESYVSYEAIESIKDGIFMNSKYECKMVLYDSPTVIVMANFEPQYTAISADRWKVREIQNLDKGRSSHVKAEIPAIEKKMDTSELLKELELIMVREP
nr:MAG: replication associated protein [Arizlama virus]